MDYAAGGRKRNRGSKNQTEKDLLDLWITPQAGDKKN
jgi:hypothetical protein